jgi:hypothetical protein
MERVNIAVKPYISTWDESDQKFSRLISCGDGAYRGFPRFIQTNTVIYIFK